MRFYYALIIVLMIIFDINHPKYFTTQNETQQYLTRTIYILLAIHFIWILSNFSLKKKIDLLESYFEISKMIKVPMIAFLFFICDEFERIALICIYYVVVIYLKK